MDKLFSRTLIAAGLIASLGACATAPTSSVSRFISIQDGRASLVNGVGAVNTAADTMALVDVENGKLVLRKEIQIPTSLVGPPHSVAITPDRQFALITAATRRDPNDAKKVIPHDVVSVIALEGSDAPRVVATVRTGMGAAGISINREGTLALVANRVEGSVSVLTIAGGKVEAISKISMGDKSGPSHAVFTPDGKRALVSRDGDNRVTVLEINGRTVSVNKRDIFAGLRPYSMDISPNGQFAVVGNIGMGGGDNDTISLIDLRSEPPRVIDTASVGQTPEGVGMLPDGRHVGIAAINGSNKASDSPFFGPARYQVFRFDSGKLQMVSEVSGGAWLQGQAFSPDGRYAVVQDALNREIRLYTIDGGKMSDTGQRLKFAGAPAGVSFWK